MKTSVETKFKCGDLVRVIANRTARDMGEGTAPIIVGQITHVRIEMGIAGHEVSYRLLLSNETSPDPDGEVCMAECLLEHLD
jgi:hypothetical protein